MTIDDRPEVRLINALCEAKRAAHDMADREPTRWFVLYCRVVLLFWKTRRTVEKHYGIKISCSQETPA